MRSLKNKKNLYFTSISYFRFNPNLKPKVEAGALSSLATIGRKQRCGVCKPGVYSSLTGG